MRRHGYKSISIHNGTPGFPNPDEKVNAFLTDLNRSQSGQIVSIQAFALAAQAVTPSIVVAIHYTYDEDDATLGGVPGASH